MNSAILPVAPAAPMATRTGKIRLLVCDDSLVIRGAIGRMLRGEPDLEIVASVRDGQSAIEAVRSNLQTNPIDVLILDIEMPVLDGMAALPILLSLDPSIRIIMASTLTLRGASITLEALALGAADYIPKPSTVGTFRDEDFRLELVLKVRGLGRLRQREQKSHNIVAAAPIAAAKQSVSKRSANRPTLLAIGSSTGGPQALFTFFKALGPKLGVPIILTQHMPASFVPLLADQITRLGGVTCKEAVDGEPLRPDHVVIAPGGRHLTLKGSTGALIAALSDAPPENYCRPSVDVMLRSAAAICGGTTVVLMLTGMGRDGLAGTQAIVNAGGAAIAQDEDSSVVWGMPGAIANAGLCRSVLPLAQLPAAVHEFVRS